MSAPPFQVSTRIKNGTEGYSITVIAFDPETQKTVENIQVFDDLNNISPLILQTVDQLKQRCSE
jgi:hypothetical protein